MSMEIHVLSDRRLPSIGDWQRAIDQGDILLKLSDAVPFADLHGALPALLVGKQTAFECGHTDARELMADSPDIHFGRLWTHALSFRWGADVDAGVAVYAAASAYASATAGAIFDCQEGEMISPQRAMETAHELEQSRAPHRTGGAKSHGAISQVARFQQARTTDPS